MPSLQYFLKPVFDHPALLAAGAALSQAEREVELSGLTRPAKGLAVASLTWQLRRPLIVLTADNEAAGQLREFAATFLGWLEPGAESAVVALPAFDGSPYEKRSPHAEIAERRAATLWNLARGSVRVLIAPLGAALGRFRPVSFYRSLSVEIGIGDEISRDALIEHLKTVGYELADPVTNVGQFSVRGGIVDLFSPGTPTQDPCRIEFFGDRVESLRAFDPGTQRTKKPIVSALVLPLAETPCTTGFFERLIEVLSARSPKKQAWTGADWEAEYSSPFPGWEFYAPLVEPHPNTLFSFLPQAVLVWDERADRMEQLQKTLEAWAAAHEEVRDVVPSPPPPEEMLLTQAELLATIQDKTQIMLKELALADAGAGSRHFPITAHDDLAPSVSSMAGPEDRIPPLKDFVLATQPAPKFHGVVKTFIEDLRARLARGEKLALLVPTEGKLERLRQILAEYQISFQSADPGADEHSPPTRPRAAEASSVPVWVARGNLEEGVAFPELRLALLSDNDLFGGFVWGTPRRKERSVLSSFISDLSDLKAGDYVVHVDHGIGLYRGLQTLEVEGTRRDFMLLSYQEDARLYVPLERLDLVERYRAAGDGAKPPLDRLGGATWARTKSRVKRALRDMAQELLRAYAERKMHGGRAAGPDTPWQKEFEDAFEFEETPDQLTAQEEIKRDLESPEPMDRLLCGDVGYGKTELAMRAAFKLVQEDRQVALLAPTTVLAFQHFATFRQRFAAFPIRVEMLSRFRSAKDQKAVLADTESGKVDILIGTHRLLSKDVRFHDFGLLVVDEEQRFGVAAKEKLKRLKVGVDVLTMSATPIPRTLHMSLGGMRDLSVIETPPRGRLAIQTTVAPFNPRLIQAAILQEKQREGQVYFVHNRVESIFSMAALLQRLVPTARIGVAHGQMGERDLERVMLKFMQGEYDVLAATALIENGLDIPRANTMIVNHADRFGLADLYQLRGRVGRSDRRAYAYFLISSEESLSLTARRRLAALKEFSDLGAGFRLAALDLELRGAGNLLGREQHGHLNAIGLDLYLKMLEQTVDELKGEAPKPEIRTTLQLGLDIKIPDDYISEESQRLRMYKRISNLTTPAARADLEAELADRYGPPPASVLNLLSYGLLKTAAEGFSVESIERKTDEICMRFHPLTNLKPENLAAFVRRHRNARLRPDGALRFRIADSGRNVFEILQNVLRELHASN